MVNMQTLKIFSCPNFELSRIW